MSKITSHDVAILCDDIEGLDRNDDAEVRAVAERIIETEKHYHMEFEENDEPDTIEKLMESLKNGLERYQILKFVEGMGMDLFDKERLEDWSNVACTV